MAEHYFFTERDEVFRDLAGWCEHRLEREYQASTACTVKSNAKARANEVELVTGMARAAYEEQRDPALEIADAHEHEGRR